jgi:hypothetical protein
LLFEFLGAIHCITLRDKAWKLLSTTMCETEPDQVVPRSNAEDDWAIRILQRGGRAFPLSSSVVPWLVLDRILRISLNDFYQKEAIMLRQNHTGYS